MNGFLHLFPDMPFAQRALDDYAQTCGIGEKDRVYFAALADVLRDCIKPCFDPVSADEIAALSILSTPALVSLLRAGQSARLESDADFSETVAALRETYGYQVAEVMNCLLHRGARCAAGYHDGLRLGLWAAQIAKDACAKSPSVPLDEARCVVRDCERAKGTGSCDARLARRHAEVVGQAFKAYVAFTPRKPPKP